MFTIGFGQLVAKKKKRKYAHVSIQEQQKNHQKLVTRTVQLKPRVRPVNKGRERFAAIAIRMHTFNKARAAALNARMNRAGSILGNEPNWHGSRRLLDSLTRTGVVMGEKSVNGVVKKLKTIDGVTNRYVIKFINFKQQGVHFEDQPRLRWFRQEVAIGQLPGIEGVGPRIHAWRLRPDGGEYVMDNVEMGDPKAETFTYHSMKQKYPRAFSAAIARAVSDFHLVTKGQHGDLHGYNILIVKRRVNKGNEYIVRIIDYGSWKSNKNTSATLENTTNKVPIYRLKNGKLFRKNENMLAKELLK